MAHTENHFEKAFESWLIENRIQYVGVDQRRRAIFARSKIKSFDFLLYPARLGAQTIIAEVKGRKFSGKSLAKLSGLQCWVTMEDVRGLLNWQDAFGNGHTAVFVFAYELSNIDIDADGRDIFNFDGRRYFFTAVKLADYSSLYKLRSPRWQTVMLGADDFRRCAINLRELLF